MSAVYNLEPQPTGKAILHTTSGDILLELFAQQTPLTCRNFLQLCLDGYYDNTIFHRLVQDFIIQGGDPTGTGAGGESSFEGGEPFQDEFHSRLKFNRRGLLGMANTGEKNDNGSQFFLTLGKTEELTGRNTMFGRVVGDTIFNLVKMGEAELTEEDGSERPLYPTKITSTEVLVNPFDDMVKRLRVEERVEDYTLPKKKTKKKAVKTLLSFGGEEDDGESLITIQKKKLPKDLTESTTNGSASRASKRAAPDEATEPPPKRRASPTPPKMAPKVHTRPAPARRSSDSPSPSPSPPPEPRRADALNRTAEEIANLKSSLRRTVASDAKPVESTRKKSALEAMIPSTSVKGRRRNLDGKAGSTMTATEQRALADFKAFQKKLEVGNVSSKGIEDNVNGYDAETARPLGDARGEKSGPEEDDEEANLCDLHFIANCESCRSWDRQETVAFAEDGTRLENPEDEDDAGWMSHQLTFAKDRLGKDLEWKRQNEKELVVIDPREKEKALKEDKRKAKSRN